MTTSPPRTTSRVNLFVEVKVNLWQSRASLQRIDLPDEPNRSVFYGAGGGGGAAATSATIKPPSERRSMSWVAGW
jgi:hypothetical protein